MRSWLSLFSSVLTLPRIPPDVAMIHATVTVEAALAVAEVARGVPNTMMIGAPLVVVAVVAMKETIVLLLLLAEAEVTAVTLTGAATKHKQTLCVGHRHRMHRLRTSSVLLKMSLLPYVRCPADN